MSPTIDETIEPSSALTPETQLLINGLTTMLIHQQAHHTLLLKQWQTKKDHSIILAHHPSPHPPHIHTHLSTNTITDYQGEMNARNDMQVRRWINEKQKVDVLIHEKRLVEERMLKTRMDGLVELSNERKMMSEEAALDWQDMKRLERDCDAIRVILKVEAGRSYAEGRRLVKDVAYGQWKARASGRGRGRGDVGRFCQEKAWNGEVFEPEAD